MGQSTSCPNCDQHLSFFHQCQDPDTQTNIDNFHPKNGHSEETGKDRILDFEREYLANYPDLPEDYEKWKENFFATSRFSNDSKLAHTVLSVAWLTSTDRKKWIIYNNNKKNTIHFIFKLLLAIGSFHDVPDKLMYHLYLYLYKS